ncbi:MAG: flagellar type III secretion system pore protein FliP, partial [Gammaproteobacteria bacterium]|nr:flagellar type III secretion system pore protein FliP [Gammaproteobacteria bacterium]
MKGLLMVSLFLPSLSLAAPGVEALTVTPGADGEQTYTLTIQVLLLMTALSVLPAALILMTSFTRIIIVLSILRQALGTAQAPSNQILLGLALFLTFFIMSPVLNEVYETALAPYLADEMTAQAALDAAKIPMREFMLAQTRDDDLALFARISGQEEFEREADVPFTLLMPAFATSELKTAFQIGFLLFIPFLVIDLVVASVLMSM